MERKTALVTGASRGIGKAIALALARDGWDMAIHYHSREALAQEVAQEIRALGRVCAVVQADVGDPRQVAAMIAQAQDASGFISCLVNNAGICHAGLFQDTTDVQWARLMDVNVSGAFYCTKALLGPMIAQKRGVILNISSIWGVAGGSCEVAYSAGKAALIGMTKALAREVGPSGIRVNCIAPGVIDTEMNEALSPADLEILRAEIPMTRIGQAEEVGALAAWLCSDNAQYITGQVWNVDGGML